MVSVLIPALGLGLAYAATPGVVNTECVRRGLARGFRPAFLVQLGALLGDGAWAVVALAGVATLAQDRSLGVALGVVGGLFLCRLAFAALREAWRGPRLDPTQVTRRGDFGTGAVFGLANPAGLAFWAGVGGGMLATTSEVGVNGYAAFLAAFLAGALGWSLGLAAFVGWGRRYVRPSLFRAIDALCGTVLGWFGIRLLWGALRHVVA